MSDEQQRGNLFQRIYERRLRVSFDSYGSMVRRHDYLLADTFRNALSRGFMPKAVSDAIYAKFPEATIEWKTSKASNVDVIIMSGGVVHVVEVKSDGGIDLVVRQSDLAKAPVASSPRPPLNAEFILHILLRREEQDAVIGDMLERYVKKHERFGERRANLWFYAEVFRSAWPLLRRAIGRVSGLMLLGEWLRRMTR